jgi:Cytidylate kinase-like family
MLMNAPLDFGRCLSFINCQLLPNARAVTPEENKMRWRAVTISREMGTGGHPVADAMADHLHANSGEGAQSWTVFDRNIVEKVLEDHHLPPRLARFMLEDRITAFEDTLDEAFGLHPSSWTLVEKTAETIMRLVEMGHVIVIGRGGNVITSRLDYVFHVRLVAPLEARAEIVQRERHLDKKAAVDLIRREDEGRRRYVKKYFHKDIDDPLLYHLVINTAVVGDANAGRLIADTMLSSAGITHH